MASQRWKKKGLLLYSDSYVSGGHNDPIDIQHTQNRIFSVMSEICSQFALILLLHCMMCVVNTELVSFASARLYTHHRSHWRFIYISWELFTGAIQSCRTNAEWQSCSFREALKQKKYLIKWQSSIRQCIFPTKVFQENRVLVLSALPVALPNRGGHNQANN